MKYFISTLGDLGFSVKSSRFFIVAYMILDHPFEISKMMKRLLKKLHERKEYARRCNELKYSNSKHAVRQIVLEGLCKCDIRVGFVVLDKAKVKPELRERPTLLYNYVIVDTVMKNVLPELAPGDKLCIIVDKSLRRISEEAFNKYAINKASWLMTIQWRQTEQIKLSNIEVRHENFQREPACKLLIFLLVLAFISMNTTTTVTIKYLRTR